MLQRKSSILVGDNTGIKLLEIIGIIGGSKRKSCGIFDIVTASVKEVIPTSTFKKGQKVKAVIVNTKYPFSRKMDGSKISFSKNYAVVVKEVLKDSDRHQPVAKIVSVPILKEFSNRGFKKLFSLAKEVL